MMLLSQDSKGRDNTLDPAYAFNQAKLAEEKIKIEIQEKEAAKSRKQREMKITGRQWKIYYYLLQKAIDINGEFIVEKKGFNISKCCKELDIKSNQTFYLAIEVLRDKELIKENRDNWIVIADKMIDTNINIISLLINYSIKIHKENNIDLLRTYFLIKSLYENNANFNDESISKLLGYEETIDYYITIYLALLEFLGLIVLDITYDGDEEIYQIIRVN